MVYKNTLLSLIWPTTEGHVPGHGRLSNRSKGGRLASYPCHSCGALLWLVSIYQPRKGRIEQVVELRAILPHRGSNPGQWIKIVQR